jgi:hypothetical protein
MNSSCTTALRSSLYCSIVVQVPEWSFFDVYRQVTSTSTGSLRVRHIRGTSTCNWWCRPRVSMRLYKWREQTVGSIEPRSRYRSRI